MSAFADGASLRAMGISTGKFESPVGGTYLAYWPLVGGGLAPVATARLAVGLEKDSDYQWTGPSAFAGPAPGPRPETVRYWWVPGAAHAKIYEQPQPGSTPYLCYDIDRKRYFDMADSGPANEKITYLTPWYPLPQVYTYPDPTKLGKNYGVFMGGSPEEVAAFNAAIAADQNKLSGFMGSMKSLVGPLLTAVAAAAMTGNSAGAVAAIKNALMTALSANPLSDATVSLLAATGTNPGGELSAIATAIGIKPADLGTYLKDAQAALKKELAK